MSIVTLLQDLNNADVQVKIKNKEIIVTADKGVLTAELRRRLIASKQEIIDWLTEVPVVDTPSELPQCASNDAHIYQPFPLSDLQQGFLLAEDDFMEFHVRPHYYSEKTYQDFNVEHYQTAWDLAIKRHEKEWVELRPDGNLEVLKNPQMMRIKVNDFREASVATREDALLNTRKIMSRHELSLEQWPWFNLQITLWKENDVTVGCVHYNHNNFFADGGGTARFMREIDAYYKDNNKRLPPLSLSIRDAIIALDNLAKSKQGQADRNYWEARLTTLPSALELPTLASMNRRCRSKLNRRHFYLSAKHWQRLKRQAEKAGLTTSNAIFSAYTEMLCAWSNQSGFIISNMMTRRLAIHPDIRDIMGNFASLYPLEVHFDTSLSFTERALMIQKQVYHDAQHRCWGGIEVMRLLNQNRDSFGQAPLPFVIGSGLFMDKLDPPEFSCLETSQVMLDHQFWELTDGRFYFVWDVLEDFFPSGLIDAMSDAYLAFLKQLADIPETWRQRQLSFIPKQQLLQRKIVTPTIQPIPNFRLEALLSRSVQNHAKRPAVCIGNQRINYQDLDRWSTQIAESLRHANIAKEELVGVLMHRSIALMASVYGILKAGGVYVPIEPSLPEERRAYILENSQATTVLTQQKFSDSLNWPEDLNVLVIEELLEQINTDSTDVSPVREKDFILRQSDLAYVIFTSGSTGQPKGVMIDHRGAINTIVDINSRFNVTSHDVIFGVSSFGFDLSVYDIFGAIASGATLVYPSAEDALNPSHWLDSIAKEHVTLWNSAPPLANLLVEAAEVRGITNDSLRLFLLSGDWIPIDLPDRLRAVFPNASIVSLGGATEASIWSIVYEIEQVDKSWNSIPYGYPLQNQSWTVLDKQGRPAPDWVTGDLYIGGIGLAKGYWRDEAKTQSSFVPHPDTGEIIYRTGDLGRYHPCGYIEFQGRSDSQVKIQGHRIELGEIETVLNQHKTVQGSIATVMNVQTRGAEFIAIFYVLDRQETTTDSTLEDTLKSYLQSKLPDYMMPRHWIALEALPLNSNGKIDRKKLSSMPLILPEAEQQIIAPSTKLEQQIHSIWQQILSVSGFGITDDFFTLGGQSYEVVRLVGQLREAFGVSLSLGDMWQLRTIEAIANRILSRDTTQTSALITLDTQGIGIPLFLVHPAGGNVLCYRALAQRLPYPVFGLQAPGIKGESLPLNSITEFAQLYAPLIDQQQPEGEIYLGGWSSGAPIAYEIASQLQLIGRKTVGIIMIDSPAPLVHTSVETETMFKWFLSDLGFKASTQKALGEQNYTGLSTEEAIKKACQTLQTLNEPLGEDAQQLHLIFDVFSGIVIGSRNYHAPTLAVDIKHFKAKDSIVHEFAQHPYQDSTQWGWQMLSTGNVQAEYISGNHYTVMDEPNLSQIVFSITEWIEKYNTDKFLD